MFLPLYLAPGRKQLGQVKPRVPGWGLVRNTGLLNNGDGRCGRERERAREPPGGACTLSSPEEKREELR